METTTFPGPGLIMGTTKLIARRMAPRIILMILSNVPRLAFIFTSFLIVIVSAYLFAVNRIILKNIVVAEEYVLTTKRFNIV